MRARAGLLALVVAEMLWGLTAVMIRYATEELGVASLTVLDAMVATSALVGLAIATGNRIPKPSWRLVLCSAMEPGVSYILFNYGIAHTSASHASLIMGTQSAIIVVLAALAMRRWPKVGVGVGLVLATAGAVLVVEHSTGIATLRGDCFVLLGTMASSLYIVFIAPLTAKINAVELTAGQFVYGSLVTIPLTIVFAFTGVLPSFDWAPTPYWLVGGAVGIVGSVVSYGLYNWALGRTSAMLAGISITLIPVSGLFLSALLLGDELSSRVWIAAVLVVAGLAVTARTEPEAAEKHSPMP
ncbi:MAG TPA: DMT family transporter [Jatrophihabitans sp.]|jgi:drug/metabolite transporter (DMT)-like permease